MADVDNWVLLLKANDHRFADAPDGKRVEVYRGGAGSFRVRECASMRVVLDDAGFLDVCYFLHEHGFVHAEVRE